MNQDDRVRVSVLDGNLIGIVDDLGSDALVLESADDASAQTIPFSQIEKVEVSIGRRSNIGKGAWIGAAAGVVAGVIWGASEGPNDFCTKTGCAALGALMLGAGGAVVGVGVGAATSGERWVEAELPAPPPVALNVGTDGLVRLAFSFRL